MAVLLTPPCKVQLDQHDICEAKPKKSFWLVYHWLFYSIFHHVNMNQIIWCLVYSFLCLAHPYFYYLTLSLAWHIQYMQRPFKSFLTILYMYAVHATDWCILWTVPYSCCSHAGCQHLHSTIPYAFILLCSKTIWVIISWATMFLQSLSNLLPMLLMILQKPN